MFLFEWTFRMDETMDEIISCAERCRDAQSDSFTHTLAGGVVERYIELDKQIEDHSDNWKLARLARVTLTVLRMGLYELHHMGDIPPGVTINEAVELMKRYASDDEASFVNGVLGSIHRSSASAGELPVPEEASPEPEQPVRES